MLIHDAIQRTAAKVLKWPPHFIGPQSGLSLSLRCPAQGGRFVLDHILRFVTLGSIIVGMAAIYAALHTNNRRLGADIFLRYSDRVSDLRRRLPVAAFLE